VTVKLELEHENYFPVEFFANRVKIQCEKIF